MNRDDEFTIELADRVSGASPSSLPPPPRRRRAGRRPSWRSFAGPAALVMGVSVLAGAAGGWYAARSVSAGGTSAGATVDVDRASVELDGETLDVAGVVEAVPQSVVSIETSVFTRGPGPFDGEAVGAGTGIVLDDGLILTNAHVVENASDITVTASGDDDARAAELVAADAQADLALLRVEDTDGLVPAPLGDSADLHVGDDVVAIGNALALEGGMTVTAGIVSAVDRSIETEAGTLSGLIQTDAAISSGNSGGPLVNAAGQVVGINTAVATSNGTVNASNIGFAVSIDTARDVVDDLLAGAEG